MSEEPYDLYVVGLSIHRVLASTNQDHEEWHQMDELDFSSVFASPDDEDANEVFCLMERLCDTVASYLQQGG